MKIKNYKLFNLHIIENRKNLFLMSDRDILALEKLRLSLSRLLNSENHVSIFMINN
jgi:hypothetical protein